MPEMGPEKLLRKICESMLTGNLDFAVAIYNLLTSEAYVDLLRIGKALENEGQSTSYRVEPLGVEGDIHQFRLAWTTEKGEHEGTVTMKEIRGDWRITAIKLPGIRD